MQSIPEWLHALGLAQYVQVFADNYIDLDVIQSISEQDLEKLGVPMGHRKKLLKAIEQLGQDDALEKRSGLSGAVPESAIAAQSERANSGERRQLTVMFCDMVGFTELANRVDPEVLQRIIRSYEDACAVCITRYEGYVFQRLGDGIVAFFGYPLAHEGEAERAIHAGRAIVDALSKLDMPDAGALAVRIGIATGLVVVSSGEKGAVGETMNLASRLQGVAQPGSIVVSERVHRLAGGAFEYASLGNQSLKGIAEPTMAYRVVGVSGATTRFEASSQGILTPLVGREQEIALLLERWQDANDGEGQVVLLSGEPGIGKSRILSALRQRLDVQGVQALQFQCSPYYINSAFWPSIDNFERALKFDRDESAESRLDKLEALIVGHYARPVSDVRFVASLLSIPCEARYGASNIPSQKHKDETLRTLVDLTEAAARRQPSVFLFEDAHWADPTTLEVLDLMIDRVKSMPLLIVITHRPEFHSRWSTQGHVFALNLSKLTRAQSEAIIAKLADGKALPAELKGQILAKTDGVPLFVEELTKSILESGELKDAGDRYEYAGGGQGLSIPATLRDSLMARLDRFMPVKEVAQIGAAIGREFSYELIEAVAPMGRPTLDDGLERLVESGLAFRRGTPPEALYIFKHALVQDAAYDSLLKSRRRELHDKIARTIETRFPAIKETEPEIVAHHYTHAGMVEKAFPLWSSAGQKALARTSLPESVAHFGRALELVQTLPTSAARDRSELATRINLAIAQMAYGGWTHSALPSVLLPATVIARRLGDVQNELVARWYIFLYELCLPNIERAIAFARELKEFAISSSDRAVTLVAGMALCESAAAAGEWDEARRHGDEVLALYEFDRDANLAFLLNHDVAASVLGWACNYYWALGFPQKARDAGLACAEAAPRIGHSFNILWALTGCTEGLFHTGDTKRALEFNQQARKFVRENAMSFGEQGPCNYFGGPALIVDGQYAAGYEMATRGLEFWNSTGGTLKDPMVNNQRAHALGMLGRAQEGIALARDVIRYTRQSNHRSWEPVTWRILGDLLVQAHEEGDDNLERAEEAYDEALRISRNKSAKGFELIAASGLARLWMSKDKHRDAHDLLAPIYGWFTEGFDTRDLEEARALLKELQSR